MQEWLDSTGSVLSSINQWGNFYTNKLFTGGGGVNLGARINFHSSTASELVLGVRSAASQTADLQQWQHSDGTAVVSISAPAAISGSYYGGVLKFSDMGTGQIKWGNNTVWSIGVVSGQTNVFFPYSNDRVAVIVKGLASQTANLQEWQDSAGTVLSAIKSGGEFIFRADSVAHTSSDGQTRLRFANNGNSTYQGYQHVFNNISSQNVATIGANGNTSIYLQNANSVGLIVKGAASQTANLTEWQNSSGTVLLGIDPNGLIYNPTNTSRQGFGMLTSYSSPIGAYFQVFGNNYSVSTQRGGAEFVFSSQNSGTGGFTVFEYNGSWNTKFKIFNSGYTSINSTSSTLGSGSATHQLGIVSVSATTVGTVIRGATSQTANLQEWQNDTGGVLAFVDSIGRGRFVTGLFGLLTSSIGSNLAVATNGTTTVGLIVRGIVSQTADLQQWQNSSGTVIGGANALAQIYTGSTAPITVTTGGATTAASGDGTTATITTTSAHGLAVGDLVTVANVTPTGYNGTFLITAVTSTTISYANATTGAQTVAGTISVPAQSSITARSAGTRGLVIRSAASQTTNLTEWQDSTGVVKAYIDNNNRFFAQSLSSTATGYQGNISSIDGTKGNLNFNTSGYGLLVTSAQASAVVLTAKGAASQTRSEEHTSELQSH